MLVTESREGCNLCLPYIIERRNLCVFCIIVRHCVVMNSIEWRNFCVFYTVERPILCTVQYRDALCVKYRIEKRKFCLIYFIQMRNLCVMLNIGRHCV